MITKVEAIDWSGLGDDRALRLRLICFYLCLSWELYLDSAEVKDRVEGLLAHAELTAYQRWVVELFQEERTSLEDGRSAFAQLKAIVRRYRNGKRVRELLLSLLPANKRAAAERHPLMGDFIGHRSGPTHLFSTRRARISSRQESGDKLPTSEREAVFDDFLTRPGFLESFELYWRKSPKNRDNKRTRVLVLAAAIVAMISPLKIEEETEREMKLLQRSCHFSVESCEAVMRICRRLMPEQLSPGWVAQSFIADATDGDRANFAEMIEDTLKSKSLPTSYRNTAERLLDEFKLT
ncbi:hypothetical protein [Cerasicoccus arenae]|uniref:Uncharacterized protein n=1 Tax=Cerasicoccus arenae TaxID=424488 RepID=A0A8J3GDD5_9BACT|nr:hypothetical protein [Cerasicoccus arenae]MBK1859500.1 hypothetical protein [Cerasicoccus arenae]GHB95002.1 hypothetical protein GCM10007047_08220 [Cerasicoccus arenae]